ncbi:MAG: amidohydrolase, partial [Methanobacteriota archaeon]
MTTTRTERPADLVLRNGRVCTMDSSRTWAEAVAIRDGTIARVGSDADVSRLAGSRTKVVDLRGRLVLPAFQDCHIHPVQGGALHLGCTLDGIATAAEYAEAVRVYAARHPETPWIRGGGWSMTAFPDGIPDKRLLDAVVPDRPVFLMSQDCHSAWVNSRALALAGITAGTPDPPRGRVDRDAVTGEPVGGLQEMSGIGLVLAHVPPYTDGELEDALRYSLQMLNGYGITSFQDALVLLHGPSAYRSLDAYRTLAVRGDLTARVVAALFWDASAGEEQIAAFAKARETSEGGPIRVGAVKIWQDGILETHTAALLEPYADRPGDRGRSHVDPEALKRIVTRLDAEGFQVHFHAIGDAAVRQCLDAVEAARKANGIRDTRHHIAHVQVIHPDDVPRFRELGVAATFQPLWACRDSQLVGLTFPLLGPERSRRSYLIRSIARSGGRVAFGSDWPVSTANPFEQVQVAVTRSCVWDPHAEPLLPEERIDLWDALAAFTIDAAYVNGQEDLTGSIEEGKLADLIVPDRDLFAIEPTEIASTQVLLTL